MLIGIEAIAKELVLACRTLGVKVDTVVANLVARTIVNTKDESFYAVLFWCILIFVKSRVCILSNIDISVYCAHSYI